MAEEDVSAVPDIVPVTRLSFIARRVKPARPDIIQQDDSLPIDTILSLFAEELGAQEFLDLSRHDLVNGERADYSLIANSRTIGQKYSPQNIVSAPGKPDQIFQNFGIRFDSHVPDDGTGDLVGNLGEQEKVYINPVNGNLIIDVINMSINERVEVQILDAGEIVNDTIDLEES